MPPSLRAKASRTCSVGDQYSVRVEIDRQFLRVTERRRTNPSRETSLSDADRRPAPDAASRFLLRRSVYASNPQSCRRKTPHHRHGGEQPSAWRSSAATSSSPRSRRATSARLDLGEATLELTDLVARRIVSATGRYAVLWLACRLEENKSGDRRNGVRLRSTSGSRPAYARPRASRVAAASERSSLVTSRRCFPLAERSEKGQISRRRQRKSIMMWCPTGTAPLRQDQSSAATTEAVSVVSELRARTFRTGVLPVADELNKVDEPID